MRGIFEGQAGLAADSAWRVASAIASRRAATYAANSPNGRDCARCLRSGQNCPFCVEYRRESCRQGVQELTRCGNEGRRRVSATDPNTTVQQSLLLLRETHNSAIRARSKVATRDFGRGRSALKCKLDLVRL